MPPFSTVVAFEEAGEIPNPFDGMLNPVANFPVPTAAINPVCPTSTLLLSSDFINVDVVGVGMRIVSCAFELFAVSTYIGFVEAPDDEGEGVFDVDEDAA